LEHALGRAEEQAHKRDPVTLRRLSAAELAKEALRRAAQRLPAPQTRCTVDGLTGRIATLLAVVEFGPAPAQILRRVTAGTLVKAQQKIAVTLIDVRDGELPRASSFRCRLTVPR
jgi:hypothetical protein